MNRVAISGASGSIGSYLVEKLTSLGVKVVTVTDKSKRIEDTEYFETFKSPEKIDVLYHLAAKSFVPDSWEHPVSFFETNIIGTCNALDFCKKYHIKMVFVSSYMYGVPINLPINEQHPLKALNPYAFSKLQAEECCKFYGDNFNLDYIIVRPFNVYGDAKNAKMLIPEIIDQIIKGEQIKVKDLRPKRDYIHINDLVDFLVLAGDSVNKEIYNIGSGKSYSVEEIINACQQVWKSSLPIISEEIERVNEIPETVCDISKAKTKFDWKPKLDLITGLGLMKQQLNKEA